MPSGAGLARRIHQRHGDRGRRAGDAVHAGSGCAGSSTRGRCRGSDDRRGCARDAGGGTCRGSSTACSRSSVNADSAHRPQRRRPGGLEMIFRPDPTVWDGRFANNGWLQELPKPLTKLTWDTAAWISPQLAEDSSLDDGDVIELRYRGHTARMPVFGVPGHPDQSVTVFFGYGRTAGRTRRQATKDAERSTPILLRTSDAPWFGSGLEIAKTGERYLLATTQEHHPMEGRRRSASPRSRSTRTSRTIIKEMEHDAAKTLTLYPDHEYKGNKWGMAIDLTPAPAAAPASSPASPRTTSRSSARSRSIATARCTGSASITTSRATSTPPSRFRPFTSRCRACSARTRRASWSARSRRRRTARKA